MITESDAAAILMRVVGQHRAAEFMHKVCWGDDAFTFDVDGTLVILPGELLKGLAD